MHEPISIDSSAQVSSVAGAMYVNHLVASHGHESGVNHLIASHGHEANVCGGIAYDVIMEQLKKQVICVMSILVMCRCLFVLMNV